MARDTVLGMGIAKFRGSELRTAGDTFPELGTAGHFSTVEDGKVHCLWDVDTVPGIGTEMFRGSELGTAGGTFLKLRLRIAR